MDKNKDEKLIKEVAVLYHKMLRKNNFFPNYNQELEFYDSVSSACRTHYEWEEFIRKVETAYFKMPFHYRRIIKHDYFYNNFAFWWEEFFTHKQYRNYKKEAIDNFINNLKDVKAVSALGVLNVTNI